MGPRRKTIPYETHWAGSQGVRERTLEFLGEEPLQIRIDDEPYLVVMRTPGEELYQAVGFCLGDGIVDERQDIERFGYDEPLEPNVIDLWLTDERFAAVRELLSRRRFVSQTSCGICGKQLIEDLYQNLEPVADGFTIHRDRVFECLATLDREQRFYETTRASHAALLFDGDAHLMTFAEDVGRHNALDKAIGQAFWEDTLGSARLIVLSSRNSYELIQKAARARVPILISKSRPTALAVALGKSLNMTLAFPDGGDLVIICGAQRISLS